MDVFRRLFFAALLAGICSGLVITVIHQFGAVPIILDAEVFEKSAELHGHPGIPHDKVEHDPAVMAEAAAKVTAEHEHEHGAWEPEDGVERTLYTAGADILTGIGFALMLVAGYTVRGGLMGWRTGLFWGLAGFATFTLAPGLGLPPELPGGLAAPLVDRQLWWVATVLATGSGLALLAFRREAIWAVAAVILIALPHVIGAPQPAEHGGVAPMDLVHRFVVTATITSLVFWLCLGASTGYLYRRFSPAA